MGIYQRGRTFWFTYTHEGKRIQRSLETGNRRLAERIHAKVLTDIIEGRYFEAVLAKTTRFEVMAQRYLAERAHSRDPYTVKHLMNFFRGLTLFEVTTPLVDQYRQVRLRSVKPATVYQELALLRRMFNVAINEWEWIKDNPVARLSFSVGNTNARDRWLTLDEEKALLENATSPTWLKTLLVVALHTGMRRGEILSLAWQDVDLARRTITVVKSKNGQKRTIPLSQPLWDALNATRVRDIRGRVFPVSGSRLRDAFKEVLKKAVIGNFRFHDLRHTFATRLVQGGVDIYKVKELLGHKTLMMTARYAHHYPESLRGSVEVLGRCSGCYISATVGTG
jgi:integrase